VILVAESQEKAMIFRPGLEDAASQRAHCETAAEMSDRSWVFCTSEKAFAGEEFSFTLTVKDGGVTLFGPTASLEPAGGGIACPKA